MYILLLLLALTSYVYVAFLLIDGPIFRWFHRIDVVKADRWFAKFFLVWLLVTALLVPGLIFRAHDGYGWVQFFAVIAGFATAFMSSYSLVTGGKYARETTRILEEHDAGWKQ